jgi:hypothetical protein
MPEPIVYQVRALDARGNPRIVHAYATEDEAKEAIVTMKKRVNARYVIVQTENQPNQYWGINFPEKKA